MRALMIDEEITDREERKQGIRIERPQAVEIESCAGSGPAGRVGMVFRMLLLLSYVFSLAVFFLAGASR